MKKVLFILLALLSCHFVAQAQIKGKVAKIEKTQIKKGDEWSGWKKGGEGLINASNTTFSQWAEGGINTINLIGNLGLFADYRKDKWLWENDARFVMGFTRTKENGFQKADDVIDLDSKLGYKLSEKAYWSTLLTFNTQFLEGQTIQDTKTDGVGIDSTALGNLITTGGPYSLSRKDTVGRSKFLSPASITLGTGIDWKPQDFISVYFSPLTFKGLIVNDQRIADSGIHGNTAATVDTLTGLTNVGTGQTFKPELGANLKVGIKRDLTKSITVSSAADFYSNFLKNSFGENKPQNIDVLWVTTLTANVNKYISATVEYTLKYDDEILVPKTDDNGVSYNGKGQQGKTFLGVGFKYKFGAN